MSEVSILELLPPILERRTAPYIGASLASAPIIAALYAAARYAFSPLYLPLQLGKYLCYINTNIFSVGGYAVKAAAFTVLAVALTVAAVKASSKLTGEVARLSRSPLTYLEYWRENKRASAALLVLAYLAIIVHASAATLIWTNILREHLATLHSILLSSAAASIAFSVALLILPNLDDTAQLTEACKKLVEEVSEPSTKEDYKKIELLTLILHVMVTDAVLRNIKQIGGLNIQPYLATITLAMIQGEKGNVQKAKQAATKLLDQLAGGEYNLLLQTLIEAEKQLPEIPEISKKMELTLNEPAQFIYAPRTRRNLALRALLLIAAASATLVAINILKWLFYFSTS
ncbi:MAG: hypothetical protein KIH01_03190 [Candidatus Freyarchaeota archaeon]|nr:hypothetical protein [Candidatus Jordarchaeia archaeon]